MPYIKVDEDVSVFYEEYGEGDKYVFTSLIYPFYYANYAKELAKRGYHVVDVQIRGYGASSRLPEGVNGNDQWSEDIIKVADHFGAKKFAYTGISHGSSIGWTLIHDHPDRISGFAGVVCGPKLIGAPSSFSWRNRLVDNELTAAEKKLKKAEETRQSRLNELREYQSEYWQDQLRKNADMEYYTITHTDAREDAMKFGGNPTPDYMTSEENLIEWLKTIKTPVIIFGGMQDPIVVPESMIRTATYVPHLKMVMFQDSDHDVALSHGEDLANDIDYFFRERKVFDFS
ncbi:MAG: alpha/beta fold hydrolase [Eubacteriaceae bacterium]|nr:alpha/beta fold hydrolase [Eubacteriaceae bacterium]MCR4893683.1 alpha/beta hydrolase [Eubacteriales bacterium]